MSEARSIVALGHRALGQGDKLCLATVVQVEGSSYRKPGARLLITSSGERAGTISGGCLESEVSRKAWWLTASGPRVERYSSFAEEDGSMPYGLGCGGTVSLLLEQGEAVKAILATLEQQLISRQPSVVVMAVGTKPGHLPEAIEAAGLPGEPHDSGLSIQHPPHAGTLLILTAAGRQVPLPRGSGSRSEADSDMVELAYQSDSFRELEANGKNPADRPQRRRLRAALMHAARAAFEQQRSYWLTEDLSLCPALEKGQALSEGMTGPAYVIEYLAPPPALTIFGAGDDAQPIVALAHALGWRVTVADGRAHLARVERFPMAADIHVLAYADPALQAACGMSRLGTANKAPERVQFDHSAERSQYAMHAGLPSQHASSPAGTSAAVVASGILSDDVAVILTHSYEQDRALLGALLPRGLLYLGILGPRHRTEQLLQEVAPPLGLSVAEAFERLHSPVGLDLGASDPATVALSIIAEIQAVLQGRRVEVTRAVPRDPQPDGAAAERSSQLTGTRN